MTETVGDEPRSDSLTWEQSVLHSTVLSDPFPHVPLYTDDRVCSNMYMVYIHIWVFFFYDSVMCRAVIDQSHFIQLLFWNQLDLLTSLLLLSVTCTSFFIIWFDWTLENQINKIIVKKLHF